VSSPHVAATVSNVSMSFYAAAIGNNQMPNYGGATITLTPTSGPVGTFVTITGIGFGDSGGCPITSSPSGLITVPICALDLGTQQMSGSFIVGNVHAGHYEVQAGYVAVAGFNVTSGSSSTSSSTVTSITTTSSSETSATSSLESTSTTFTMTVTKTVQAVIQTSLSFGSVVGSSVVITVTLTGSSHGLVGPISGQTVSVSVSSNWSSSGSCTTTSDGGCQVTLSKPPNGSYTVTVKFAGNSYFEASVGTGIIVVK